MFPWPVTTVFGFLGRPDVHYFMKPTVTRRAAEAYGVDLTYTARPSWAAYESVPLLCDTVMKDLADLRPRDLIDVQSFLWVQGSDEYP